MILSHSDRWIPVRSKPIDPRIRLFCFPYAGAGASIYRSWSISGIEVCGIQLPGREGRITEALYRSMDRLVDEAANAISRYDDLPRAFYGHSMGALVAYELIARLGGAHLFVSGCSSPRRVPAQQQLHRLPDAELIAAIASWNGTPEAVLREPELMSLMLPVVRADLEIFEQYATSSGTLLQCPITAIAGDSDDRAPAAGMENWRSVTKGPFRLHVIKGGHFFLRDSRQTLLELIQRELGVERT